MFICRLWFVISQNYHFFVNKCSDIQECFQGGCVITYLSLTSPEAIRFSVDVIEFLVHIIRFSLQLTLNSCKNRMLLDFSFSSLHWWLHGKRIELENILTAPLPR